jgi:nitroreductase
MEFQDIIQNRRSVREFRDEAVPDEKLSRVLEAARLAPSAGNRQPWKFVVIKDANKRKALTQSANNQAFVGQAPIIIVAVALMPMKIMTCGVPSYAVDLAIAIEHIVLAAVDEGLGTCWIGAFSQEDARNIVGIPDKYKVVTVMPIGYPVAETAARSRKPIEEVVCYERFKEY